MRCPFCSCDADKDELKVKVVDSRECENGLAIRRRRLCGNCGKRFTTYERVEETRRLTVVKSDGRREPWDRQKVENGVERACYKRQVEEAEKRRIVNEVEEEVFTTYDKEVPSSAIGQRVADRLRRVDQVAYVRFASVYRQFKTLEELVAEARAVLDAQRYDVPGQGRLFLDEPAAGRAGPAAIPGNATSAPGPAGPKASNGNAGGNMGK